MTITNNEESILQDLETYIGSLFPRLRAMDKLTMHYILNRAIARALADLYVRQEEILVTVDPLQATGSDLEHITSSRLLYRRLGDYATGYLTFSRNSPSSTDTTIPVGTRCTADDIFFRTTELGTLLAGTISISVAAKAELRGLSGNVSEYTINNVYGTLSGIDYVTNPLAFANGTMDESDTDLRQRYIDIATIPGLATKQEIELHLVDLENVDEARVFNRSAGDIEVIVRDTLGTGTIDTDVTDCLELNIASGCQASGVIAAVATPGGFIVPIVDPVSLTSVDCAGGLVWVRPMNFVSVSDSFDVDYKLNSGIINTGTVTVPIGTHRGEIVPVVLEALSDRAVSIPSKVFTGQNVYDVLIGLGVKDYLYNVPTEVTFSVTVTYNATDTPEADLSSKIADSISAWLGDYTIGEQVEWSDIRTISTIKYVKAPIPTQKHQILGTETPFVGIQRINSFVVAGGGNALNADGGIIVLEDDEIVKVGTISVSAV